MVLLNSLLKKRKYITEFLKPISWNFMNYNLCQKNLYVNGSTKYRGPLPIIYKYQVFKKTCLGQLELSHHYASNANSRLNDSINFDQKSTTYQACNDISIFGNPKEALNILQAKKKTQIFSKDSSLNNEWVYTYSFVWPEKIKFKSTSKSKRVASHDAAATALQWLYSNKYIAKEISRGKSGAKAIPVWNECRTDAQLQKIVKVFPNPKETLNVIRNRDKAKMFRKKYTKAGDRWSCVYSFVWPEIINFESTCTSKQEAGDLAAARALQWLYENKYVTEQGRLTHVMAALRDNTSQVNIIPIEMSGDSIEMLNRVWEDYESNIKNIYEKTFEENEKLLHVQSYQAEDTAHDEYHLEHPVYGRKPFEADLDKQDMALRRAFKHFDAHRTPLPIDQYFEEIISTIEKSPVTMIVGEPGCGKSSRLPAAMLRRWGAGSATIVSEPRRVAAIGLARRVADELGQEVGQNIGHQVRLDSNLPTRGGGVLYCTSGVLLHKLRSNPGLAGVTHVVLDEAHERDINTDVSILLLRRTLQRNPRLKLIIMSATLNTDMFQRYFDGCPVVQVPGRSFPVDVIHLEDIPAQLQVRLPRTAHRDANDSKPRIVCEEVVDVINAVDRSQPEGAILVFLPGWSEIKNISGMLEDLYHGFPTHMIVVAHSRVSTADQLRIFSKPPAGVRKIILSTNIAEASVTVPDVVYVVDTGAHNTSALRRNHASATMELSWVSQAAAKQRAGRAGRVQPGRCYRLYSKKRETEFEPYMIPEIQRITLEQLVLECKGHAPGERARDFTSQLPEPPSDAAVTSAVTDLISLGALSPAELLTPLGALLAGLGVHPRLGVSLLHAAVAGELAAVADIVVHCSDNLNMFIDEANRTSDIRNIKSEFSKTSDHMALHLIKQKYAQLEKDEVQKWCSGYGLLPEVLERSTGIAKLYTDNVTKTGLADPNCGLSRSGGRPGREVMTVALLLSGFNSLVTCQRCIENRHKKGVKLLTSTGQSVHISSSSVNYDVKRRAQATALLTSYGDLYSRQRRALVAHTTSLVSPHTALLFTMADVVTVVCDEDRGGSESTVLSLPRHGIQFEMAPSLSITVMKTREMLWNTFKYHIERNQDGGSSDTEEISAFREQLFETLNTVLVEVQRKYLDNIL